MARGFNKVIIMGNLARDPDVRYTPAKQKVARITVAVGRQWKNKVTGEVQNHTDFVPVVAWSFSADICERYLKKGSPVLVEGRLSVRDFDDAKTGTRRWVTEVVCESITMLSGGRRDESPDGYRPQASPQGGGYQQSQGQSTGYQPQGQNTQNTGYQPYGGQPAPYGGGTAGGDVGSLRDEKGFGDDFPMDISDFPDEGEGEVDIPF